MDTYLEKKDEVTGVTTRLKINRGIADTSIVTYLIVEGTVVHTWCRTMKPAVANDCTNLAHKQGYVDPSMLLIDEEIRQQCVYNEGTKQFTLCTKNGEVFICISTFPAVINAAWQAYQGA